MDGWGTMTPAVRRAVAELGTTRWQWRWALMGAIEKGTVKRGDLPPTVVRTLVTSKEQSERVKAEQLFGRVQATSAEKLRLIAEKRRVVVQGAVDLNAGREVARKSCLICHKLHGEGAEVGPDLTGVGRSSLDALLHNVIHPNEIIGQGYENVVVETRDGRTVSGRMVENGTTRVRLLMAGGVEEVLSKADVKSLVATENSVMPEGLEQMPDADFRNLIWFILAPPEDGKPLDEGRRRELMGGAGDSAALAPGDDGESVALWAPGWRVDAPDFGGSPSRLPSWEGHENVLVTHPRGPGRPATLHGRVLVPSGGGELRIKAGAATGDEWELVVRVAGETARREAVSGRAGAWREVRVDLGRHAGREVEVVLENGVAGANGAFGRWTVPVVRPAGVAGR
jgi:putative heme-binding domain-containing protein